MNGNPINNWANLVFQEGANHILKQEASNARKGNQYRFDDRLLIRATTCFPVGRSRCGFTLKENDMKMI